MDNLEERLIRELAPEAEALSSLLNQKFYIEQDDNRPASAYVFEIEKPLPGFYKKTG